MSILKTRAPADLRWTYLYMAEDDHDSTKLKTLYQGLEFVFKGGATAGDISGSWSGAAEIHTADGQENRLELHAFLKRAGNTLSGWIGPSPGRQFVIANGRVNGESIEFHAAMPTRVYRIRLQRKTAESLEGEISSEDGKANGAVSLQRVK